MIADRIVLTEFTEKHSADLSRLCLGLCGNHADADDLFQETWLKVYQRLGSYDETRPFEGWLYTICVNTFRDMCRSAFRKKAISFSDTEEKDRFLDGIPDKSNVGEELMEVIDVIRRMSPKYREVLALRFFKDYSEEQTAEILGVPLGTVKSRISRAREILRRELR